MLADSTVGEFFAWGALLLVIELAGPVIAERRRADAWHAHHIAERYGLLTIITLGEGVIGTVASLGAVVESQGWTLDAALVAVAGTGLTFGMWWMYFTVPSAEVLHVHRERLFPMGLRPHSDLRLDHCHRGRPTRRRAYIGHEAHIGSTATVLTVASRGGFRLSLFALYSSSFGPWIRSTSPCSPGPRRCSCSAWSWRRFRASMALCLCQTHARAAGDRGRLRDRRPPAHVRRGPAHTRPRPASYWIDAVIREPDKFARSRETSVASPSSDYS